MTYISSYSLRNHWGNLMELSVSTWLLCHETRGWWWYIFLFTRRLEVSEMQDILGKLKVSCYQSRKICSIVRYLLFNIYNMDFKMTFQPSTIIHLQCNRVCKWIKIISIGWTTFFVHSAFICPFYCTIMIWVCSTFATTMSDK